MATVSTVTQDALDLSGARSAATKPGIISRFFNAIIDARQRQADRELAQILSRRGGIMAPDEPNALAEKP